MCTSPRSRPIRFFFPTQRTVPWSAVLCRSNTTTWSPILNRGRSTSLTTGWLFLWLRGCWAADVDGAAAAAAYDGCLLVDCWLRSSSGMPGGRATSHSFSKDTNRPQSGLHWKYSIPWKTPSEVPLPKCCSSWKITLNNWEFYMYIGCEKYM